MNIVWGVADLLRKAPPPPAPGGGDGSAPAPASSLPAGGLDNAPTPRVVFRYACLNDRKHSYTQMRCGLSVWREGGVAH